MKRDPAQLSTRSPTDPRYRYVRKWLFDRLVGAVDLRGRRTAGGARPRPAAAAEEQAPRTSGRTEALAADARGLRFVRPGALAKLAKAPASKVGDSRFESWVPRSRPPAAGF